MSTVLPAPAQANPAAPARVDRTLAFAVPNGAVNRLAAADAAAHDWYRFVLSYPPHLVRHYLEHFGLDHTARVLDPFCGTGTTLVESKKQGLAAIGLEAHPMTAFASGVKTDWRPDPAALRAHAVVVASAAAAGEAGPTLTLPPEQMKLLLTNSISPRPLHRILALRAALAAHADPRYAGHERLALARTLVETASNLHFGPEVGVGPAKEDAPVLAAWLRQIEVMAADLEALQATGNGRVPVDVIRADARDPRHAVAPAAIDAVICSPPYPNEKDYTRTTRLESVILGFITTPAELRAVKQGLVRSNSRTVYRGDDDHHHLTNVPEIEAIARQIEARRIELGKTSGFERRYHDVVRLYFGGMARHLAELRPRLRPGAQLAYVVGDQASFLRVMIRTGELLAIIAERLGYQVTGLDLFRTRLATATREQMREEVLLLRLPG